jgi:hypothetical protein
VLIIALFGLKKDGRSREAMDISCLQVLKCEDTWEFRV